MGSAKHAEEGRPRFGILHLGMLVVATSATGFFRARPAGSARWNQLLELKDELHATDGAGAGVLAIGLVMLGLGAILLRTWSRYVARSLPRGPRSAAPRRDEGATCFWAFAFYLALAMGSNAALAEAGLDRLTSGALAYLVGGGIALAYLRARTRPQSRARFLRGVGVYVGRRPLAQIGSAIAGLAVLFLLLAGVGSLVVALSLLRIADAGPLPRLLLMGILLPLVEELMFRGVLQRAVGTLLGPRETVLIVATVFCFAHPWGPLESAVTFAAGVLLSVLRLHGRSLLAPATLHIGNNLLAVAAACTA